ncbi:MAG TPA: DNA sulfur modification protein DndB [Candidatus Acidoferrales bacterium]|jgi:DNA sulfur modification protein DndB|nr:DNA sulfur modification protein DndB [Candidatus Acidoferrales bacterium]
MANKTLIPALSAKVGGCEYYICTMKYAEVARQVGFAHELGGNDDLSTMIQRTISARTKEITDYLLASPHRFLGSLIVAARGGSPEYTHFAMDDPDDLLTGIDRGFGVLTFDGTQQYFALDGQHRLRAIKDAIKLDPEIGKEDVCVLLVSHFDTEDGRTKTRRLFTNINRNAKVTTSAENIALDEDYGINILTRRFLTDHEFLKRDGVVLVFTKQGDEGELSLAGNSIPKTHPKALTSIAVLNELLKELAFDLPPSITAANTRPTSDVLEFAYTELSKRVDVFLKACGNIRERMLAAVSACDVRAPKNNEGAGHAFMRPVVQKAVARVVKHIVSQKVLSWAESMDRLSKLDWEISKAPWVAVYAPDSEKMLTGKEFTELLFDLLLCHLAPPSKQAIKKARKEFKDIRNFQYPVSEEDLCARLLGSEDDPNQAGPAV